jgi:hypothetical protein
MNATVATNKIAAKLSALASKGITVTVSPSRTLQVRPARLLTDRDQTCNVIRLMHSCRI